MRPLAKAALALVLLALGAGTAIAAVAVHEIRPWGLPLAVLATLVTLWALPAGWWLRLPFAVGWTCLVAWVVTPRAEGDFVISADGRGYVLLGLALVVLILGIATLPRPGGRRRRRAAAPAREPRVAAPEI